MKSFRYNYHMHAAAALCFSAQKNRGPKPTVETAENAFDVFGKRLRSAARKEMAAL